MINPVRILLYVALVLVAGVSGFFALTNFGRMMDRAADRTSDLEQIERERPSTGESPEATGTNSSTTTSAPSTVEAAATNLSTDAKSSTLSSNAEPAASVLTNGAGLTQTANPAPVAKALSTKKSPKAQARGGGGRMGLWTALFVVSIIGLGLLIANDVSHFLGNRTLKTLYNDDLEGVKNPEYEQAEQIWANGQHLEAIGLMREYLAKNPREQHVAMRIAEIYEKDLNNQLAAALEYEEVLKHKLAPERWGWAAIHLCNLYFKLNQEQKAYDLLHRLVKEYPNTAAAEKGRKRLEQVEGALPQEPLPQEPQINTAPRVNSEPTATAPSNLPPGFRPKK